MKSQKKILTIFALLCFILGFSAPPAPPGGGTSVGPGAPASPIDNYVFLLIPIAILMIAYFAKNYKKQLN